MANTVMPPRLTGKDEMNLADFAICVIGSSAGASPTTIERSQKLKIGDGFIEQKWILTASSQYGFPQTADDDVLLALIYLASEARLQFQKVESTRYELRKIMGWPAKVFGIIDSFQIVEGRDGERRQKSFAQFSEVLWESIQAENLKKLDLDVYYGLRSPIAKRLYRFLDKRKHNKTCFELELQALAEVNIGLSSPTRVFPSQIKQTLVGPHKELNAIGFLNDVNYFLGNNGAWRIRYRFGSGKTAISESDLIPNDTVRLLVERGVSAKVAVQLAEKDLALILDLVDYFDFVQQQHKGHWKNPTGWLVKAIQEEYTVYNELSDYVPRAQRVVLEEDKRRAQERSLEMEKAARLKELSRTNLLDSLPPQELLRVATLLRSRNLWMKKMGDDHPAMRAAIIDAIETGQVKLEVPLTTH